MDFWIPLLGSALGGAVITAIFGLFKGHQEKLTEREQWLRDQKMSEYVAMLGMINSIIRHNKALIEDGAKAVSMPMPEEIQMSALSLLAPKPVRRTLGELVTVVTGLTQATALWITNSLEVGKSADLKVAREALQESERKFQTLISEMRKDLNVKL
jgi:hypothetical protein